MPNTLSQGGFLAQGTVLLEGEAKSATLEARRLFSRRRIESEAVRDERQRIRREVHDGVLQGLTAVSLQLATLRRLIDADPGAAREHCDKLQDIIATEQRALRVWLAEQHAPAPEAKASAEDLMSALSALCLRAESQWGLRVEMLRGVLRPIPTALADHIYRIVQEALANAGKHACASTVRVRIESRMPGVAITVADDGVGFAWRGRRDLPSLRQRGNGPQSLIHRVESLDGQISVTSQASGTTIEILLPVPDAVAKRFHASA